jgi:2-polyprenyl-3-methyl-5-hydroxy-6-metoxy-1,4-benzoquinol methylase
MNKYQVTFATWNKVATMYQDRFMDLDLYDDTYDVVCQRIRKDTAKILDIGCGPGNITKYLLSKNPNYIIFGIDIAPNMVTLAKLNNPSASFAVMDSREVDKVNDKYDGIICGFCLPYLSPSDTEKLIADCHKLLYSEGLFYLSFVEGDPSKSGYQSSSSGDKVYFYFHQLENIISQLVVNNFRDIQVFNVDYHRSDTEVEVQTVIIALKA